MDDQVFADDLSLESLIREGRVTHLCSGGAELDETAVLTALCDAVAGQIYRIDPLTYVFRICDDDLGGSLAGTPVEGWAGALARRVRSALRLPAEAECLQVRALRREQAADQQQPQAVEPHAERDVEPEPQDAASFARSDDATAQDSPAEEAEPMEALQAEPGDEPRSEAAEEAQAEPAPGAQAAPSAPDAVLARLDALELRLGELQSCMTGLAAQAAAQTEASRSLERTIGELARARREPPGIAATHPSDQTGVLAPLAVALTSALRRMEEQETAPDLALQLVPVQDGLAQLRDEVMALSRRLEARSAAPDDLAQRLDKLSADLRGLPERAAAQVTARTGSLAPMHVALSGALHRLERQIEALAAIGPDAGPDAGLRLAMAEFLSRLEQGILIPTAD